MVVEAHVKDSPKNDVLPDCEFTVVKRDQITEPGWVDLTLDGTITGALIEKTFYSSVKIYPTGSPAQGTTVAVINMPVKWRATR